MKCLGHLIDDDAGIRSCFDSCKAAMWRCFYGNLSAGLMASSSNAKMRFLHSSVSSIAAFRWSRWPYQEKIKAALDDTHRHMIGILMGWRPQPHQTFEQFVVWRRDHSNRLAARHGKWSKRWALSLQSWKAHIDQNHDPSTWSSILLNFHHHNWLQERRLLASSGNESRTNTRACHMKIRRRWHEGLRACL